MECVGACGRHGYRTHYSVVRYVGRRQVALPDIEQEGSQELGPDRQLSGMRNSLHTRLHPRHEHGSHMLATLDLEVQQEEDKLDGDAALNKVFQDIYSRGSEEQRRAMMKSFVESNGTVLSTNWEDVGSREVKGSPPKVLPPLLLAQHLEQYD